MKANQKYEEVKAYLELAAMECVEQAKTYESVANALDSLAIADDKAMSVISGLSDLSRSESDGFKSIVESIRAWLLCFLVVFLSACHPMKTYRKTEVYRAAPVGAKALRQYSDNYACPDCLRLPDGQIAQPGQWVAIDGEGKYHIIPNAEFRRKYRRK